MLRRSKSGVSTILGALIFVGIIFTCVIPLFLYVNQVNSIYDKTVIEKRWLDQEREMERLEVYAFPDDDLTKLNVYIKNKCALEVRVVRLWVNHESYDKEAPETDDLPLLLSGVSEDTITLPGNLLPGYYDVWVTTDRGNVFASLTNTLVVTEDGWEPGAYNFGIHIFITGGGTYHVTVTDDSEPPIAMWEGEIQAAPNAYRIIQLPKPGTYHATITKGTDTWEYPNLYVSWTYPRAQIQVPP